METKDLKGISWVGNIYQKFEAMCLEVEEIMYQDTVKYVENQVQTVGSSVKKFYSDVMQDFLPPSSVDAAKGAHCDLPLELSADVGFYMKPKIGMEGKHVKADDIEKLTEDPEMTFGANAEHPQSFQVLSHVDDLFPLSQGDSAGGASRQYGKWFLSTKSNLGTKKISEREIEDSAGVVSKQHGKQSLSQKSNLGANKNLERESMFPNEKSRIIAPLEKELPRTSFYKPSNETDKASFDQRAIITTSESVDVTGHGIIEKSKNAIENATDQMSDIPAEGSSSDMMKLIESGMNKEMDMRPSSCGSSLAEENATDVCTEDEVIHLVESCANGEVQRSKISCEEDFVSNSGWSNDRITDVNKVDTSVEHQLEIVQEVDKTKLEESCIIVNGDEFQFAPCSKGKSKSYKKKIRDVFSPTRRSIRKHEYEQLAIWPGSDSNPNQEDHAKNSMPSLTIKDADKFPAPESSESEWELL